MRSTALNQRGLSLIELMISMVAGSIVVAGVTSVFFSSVSSSSDTLKQSKLNQEIASLMIIMGNDLRRAGTWGNMKLPHYDTPTTNPFAQANDTALDIFSGTTKITPANMVKNATDYPGGNCILYSYDTNKDGLLDNADVLGYRLIQRDGIGVVQMRTSSSSTGVHNRCDDGGNSWVDATDGNFTNVTSLNFTLENSSCFNTSEPDGTDSPNDADTTVDNSSEYDCYTTTPVSGNITSETRQIDITLTAELVSDRFVKHHMAQSIRVRNDLVLKR